MSATSTTANSTNPPLLCGEVDLNTISFSDAMGKPGASFKSAFINYNNGSLIVQTPWLKTWDGITEQAEEYRQPGAPPKYSLNFSLRGPNSAEVAEFQSFLEAFDDKVLTEATANSSSWLKRKTSSKEVCAALFSNQLRLAKDKDTGDFTDKYPASFKVKIPYYDGVWKCELFNDSREEITDNLNEHLTGQCDVRAVLKCSAVWIAGGKFGVTWQAQQIEYRARNVQAKGYRFRQTAEDAAQPPQPPQPPQPQQAAPSTETPDSDVE